MRAALATDAPLLGVALDLAPGERVPPHHHDRAQLVYASHGVLRVETAAGAWVAPPQRAVWVPAGTDHSLRAVGSTRVRTLYVRRRARGLPRRCCVVTVSPLLRELVLRMVELGAVDLRDARRARLAGVLLDEVRDARVAPLHLPAPRDPHLRALAAGLERDPGDRRTLLQWGRALGASERTLARRFAEETGLGFRAWRQQLRILRGLELLADGRGVVEVALELGYESPSAFVAMFRRQLGTTPGRYFAPA